MKNGASDAARWCAVALGFSIPISVALDNLLVLIFLLAWLAAGNYADKLRDIRAHPVAIAALLFASVMIVGMAWSPRPLPELRHAAVDALTFALLAPLLTVFRDERTREHAITAFLVASTLVLATSFTLWSGLADAIPGTKGRPDYPLAFKFHITHNILMAAAAVFAVLRAISAQSRRTRFLYAALAGGAGFNVLFMIPGRTGQLALGAVALYIAYSQFRWRGIMVISLGLVLVIASAWMLPSSPLHERAARAFSEASQWRPGEAQPETSSIGMRLEFYTNSLTMIAQRPLIGAGSGGFRSAYADEVAGTGMVVTDHPHNAFLLVAAELGLLGIAALFWMLATQWRTARLLPGSTAHTSARSLLLIFVTAGLVSSTFSDHAEALFFVWASALLWGSLGTWRA